jgi:selenide,water dikinase
MDFFTPIVDDPYAYGQIAAANSLSDVYAMGGRPLTVMNIACFNPVAAPAKVWADVLRGAYDKTIEAGAVVVGGHSINDKEPKFGLSVTGVVNPNKIFANTEAKPGDGIYLSKPLGTGIVCTAFMKGDCPPESLEEATRSMCLLNRDACERGLELGVRCATDITGFGLAGHMLTVARSSKVGIEIDSSSLPLFPHLKELVEADMLAGGLFSNESFVGDAISFADGVPEWMRKVIFDPQTSGGLALFSSVPVPGMACIGRVFESEPAIRVLA